MTVDFTVVIEVRQRFGDNQADDRGLETEAPFVGRKKQFEFSCPNVDRSQQAILLFQSQGVNSIGQRLEINGHQIFGGIPRSIDIATVSGQVLSVAQWNGNIMLIHPRVLQEDNVLQIQAGEIEGGNVDDFIIDNVVVLFKTKRRLGQTVHDR